MSKKKIFYEKRGRRYHPIHEYDQEFLDGFPKGNHLVMCYPGGKSRRFNINPNYAAMIAAGRVAEDAISAAIVKATNLRPRRGPLTPEQRAAWDHLVEVFGPEARALGWPSAREACEDAVEAMQKEADKLMKHESVRKAFEHFQLVCTLVNQNTNEGVK